MHGQVIDICPCLYAPNGQKPYYQYGWCNKKQVGAQHAPSSDCPD